MSKYCLHLLNNAFLHWLTLVYWFQFQLALGETEMILVTKRTSSEESDDWKMEWSHGEYFCSCLVYLYKSMSIWNLMYNCPGWVFCPQKPHPFGNEYHSMCFVECAVMLNVEVVKGKDCPWKLGPSKFKDCCGKTVGLFCLCWRSIFSTGRYIIFDSSFCVLKGIVELKKMGFCGGIEKKLCYWPSLVHEEAINSHFQSKDDGDTDVLSRKLSSLEYFIWIKKKSDCIIEIIGAGGALVMDGWKETCRKWTDRNKLHSKNSTTSSPSIGIFITTMLLMTTITSNIFFQVLKTLCGLIVGQLIYLYLYLQYGRWMLTSDAKLHLGWCSSSNLFKLL